MEIKARMGAIEDLKSEVDEAVVGERMTGPQ